MNERVKISYFERIGIKRREIVKIPECSKNFEAKISIKQVWTRAKPTDQYSRCMHNEDKVLILRVVSRNLKMVGVIGCDGCSFNTQ